MSNEVLHVSVFTRINVALGVLAFSLAPLLFVAGKITAGAMGLQQWVIVIAAVIALQLLLLVAQKRCSSEAMPFWRGLLAVGASMRTRWLYTDIAIALLAIPFTLVAACLFLARRDPSTRFHRLVYRFYEHRMLQ